ncbi:4595_t:CDS:2 [Entrophospora sp. SA101]|nr:4595_t:CDS:2 [Entrophospora sp. SA101]CAJ0823390.1 15185_t:CDS:2 [Entrophospora sp. SA101]
MNVKNETNMQQNIQFLPDIMLSPLSLSEDLFPPLVAPKPQKISPIVSKDIAGNASPTYGNHITSQNAQQAFSPIHDYPIKYNQQNRYFYENYSNNSSQTSLGTPTPGQYIHGQQSPEFIIGSDGNPTPPSLLKTGHLYGNRTSTPELRLSMSSTGSRSPVIRLLIDEKKEKRRSMTSLTLKNDETALQKYAEAAKKLNDPNIQIDYAKFLINMEENHTKSNETNGSESVEEDPTTNKFREEIKYWINLLVKNNHPEALYIKGTWYEHGKYGKKVKPDKAYKLYLSSTKCDFSKAAYKVAQHCERNRDVKRAIQFYKKSAAQGNVPSLYRLAQIDMLGDFKQESNHKQALIYLKQAAAKADEECPEVAYVYGMLLAKQYRKANIPDDLVSPDDYAAKDFIKKAANLGYGPALYKMGHCYEYKKLTCPFDPLLSISYYKRASEMGEEKADLALSRWYLCGAKGCFDPDEALAYEHAEKAASKGIAEAEFMMGYFYDMGIHVPANAQIANEWFTKAAEKGNEDAKKRLDKGITDKDFEEIIELKKQSKDFNALHEDQHLNVCKYYRHVYDTPSTKEDESKWKGFRKRNLFIILSPYDNEQNDLLNRIYKDPNLVKMTLHYELTKHFITHESIPWSMIQGIYGTELRQTLVFPQSDEYGENIEESEQRYYPQLLDLND